MADISKIKPNGASGEEYEIKDTTARTGLASKLDKDEYPFSVVNGKLCITWTKEE